jgi:hypothetical protein
MGEGSGASLAFVACVERGALESQAVLLCRSIRRFGGRFRQAPIHLFSPRRGREPRAATVARLAELGAVYHAEVLNAELPAYGTLNKVFVCAHAEEILREEILVFLDSDTVFTGEPLDLELPAGVDGAVRPAASDALNSSGPDDPRDGYWRQLYRFFGLRHEPFVETELGTRVRAYFSAGLVAVRREAGLFRSWRSDFRRLVRRGLLPSGAGFHRMDEIALAATLVRAFHRVRVLDGRYNYLLYRRSRMPAPWRQARLEDLVHLHYRQGFHSPGYLRSLSPPFDPESEVLGWLESQLPLAPPFTGSLPE